MSITAKYNAEERAMSRRIYKINTKQHKLRKEWLDLDIALNTLKLALKGKYKQRGIKK